jgi:hypothetical protein
MTYTYVNIYISLSPNIFQSLWPLLCVSVMSDVAASTHQQQKQQPQKRMKRMKRGKIFYGLGEIRCRDQQQQQNSGPMRRGYFYAQRSPSVDVVVF